MTVPRLLCVLLLCAAAASAEDLVLVDGRYLQVKILSDPEPDRDGFRAQVLETGGVIYIPWDRVIERDRVRLMKQLGLLETPAEMPTETGARLLMKTGDVLLGRIVKETPEEVTLRRNGVDETYKRALIAEISQEAVPINVVEKAETLLATRTDGLKPDDGDIPAHLELAEFAELLGLYEDAVRHYLKVQTADPEYEPQRIKAKLGRLEELAKNKAFRDALAEVRRFGNAKLFKKAFAQLDELEKASPSEGLAAEVRALRDWTTKKRKEHFWGLVRERYLVTVKNKIAAMSRDEKLKLAEAQAQLRSKLGKEAMADLAQRLEIEAKEAEELWKDRRFSSPRYASYGSGTFIVVPMSQKAQQQQAELQRYLMQEQARRAQQNRGGNGGQTGQFQSEPFKIPKPPTKDEWWTRSKASEREAFMFAYWVQNAKMVEVVGEFNEDCTRCGGSGSLPIAGQQGDTIRTTCVVCHAHGTFKAIRFK
jgi:tetratricopeptide (TPR) repeat protein